MLELKAAIQDRKSVRLSLGAVEGTHDGLLIYK